MRKGVREGRGTDKGHTVGEDGRVTDAGLRGNYLNHY